MRGFRCDNLRTKRTTAQAASAAGPTVTNATLTVTAATAGGAGNSISFRAITGAPTLDATMAAAISNGAITVTLGTDGAGVLDDSKNTGTLVSAAIDALDEVSCAVSGTGAGVVAPFTAVSLALGHDVWGVSRMAKVANVTDKLIQDLENGGNCDPQTADRIANALSIATSALGTAL